jgi:hypothetical protein
MVPTLENVEPPFPVPVLRLLVGRLGFDRKEKSTAQTQKIINFGNQSK